MNIRSNSMGKAFLCVISDARTGHGDDSIWIETVGDVLGRIAMSAETMGPTLSMEDVTILLDNDILMHGTSPVHALQLEPSWPGECDIAMFKLEDAPPTDIWNFTLAHEMFHCVQAVTWRDQEAAIGAIWWVESSANYFATLALPDSNGAGDSIQDFGERM